MKSGGAAHNLPLGWERELQESDDIRTKQPRQVSDVSVCCSEKAQQLAQARLHRARRWIKASPGRHPGVYQGAAEQDFCQVHINLDACMFTFKLPKPSHQGSSLIHITLTR